MRNVFTILAVAAFASAASAEDTVTKVTTPVGPLLSGEVSLDFAETAAGDIGGTMNLDLGVDVSGLATVDLNFEATDGNAVTLDTWAVGTTVAGVGVAVGDDLGVMPGAEGEQTLAAPAMAEAVQVTVGNATVAVGLTDWTTDVTDVSNVQGAYTIDMDRFAITGAMDYNMDSENTVLGGSIGRDIQGVGLTGVVTYDVDGEKFAFEGVANVMGITAYANGDQDDAFQNVGGEYTYNIGGAALTAGANYNVDTEDFAPTAGLSFNF